VNFEPDFCFKPLKGDHMGITTKVPLTNNEKKQRLVRCIILAVVILAAILVLVLTGTTRKAYYFMFGSPVDRNNTPAHAAEEGIAILNTVAYGDDYGTWKESVCQVSTEAVCSLVKGDYGNLAIQTVESTKTNITASNIRAITMVDQSANSEKPQQLWAVQYTLTSAGETQDKISYVIVTQENGVWKFGFYVPLPQGILEKLYATKLTPTATTK